MLGALVVAVVGLLVAMIVCVYHPGMARRSPHNWALHSWFTAGGSVDTHIADDLPVG